MDRHDLCYATTRFVMILFVRIEPTHSEVWGYIKRLVRYSIFSELPLRFH